MRPSSFPAIIESLDQLDDATRQPLFLAGVRLRVDEHGTSLPTIIQATRTLADNTQSRHTLDTKLLHAGYVDAAADHYTRRFATVESRILAVTTTFPRLTRSTVPQGVIAARYELDLEHAAAPTLSMQEALQKLGVL